MSDTNSTEFCKDKPCKTRTFQRPNSKYGNSNCDMSGRPILYTGVLWVGLFRRFLIPRTCGSSLQSTVRSRPSTEGIVRPETKDVANRSVAHASPVLLNDQSTTPLITKEDEEENDEKPLKKRPFSHTPLTEVVYQLMEVTEAASENLKRLSEDIRELVEDGSSTTAEVVVAMRDEEATGMRLTAVTLSGLGGWLSGGRRSPFTSLIYSATSATAMAVVCYPEEAQRYNDSGLASLYNVLVVGLDLLRNGPRKSLSEWAESINRNENEKTRLESSYYSSKQNTQKDRTNISWTSGPRFENDARQPIDRAGPRSEHSDAYIHGHLSSYGSSRAPYSQTSPHYQDHELHPPDHNHVEQITDSQESYLQTPPILPKPETIYVHEHPTHHYRYGTNPNILKVYPQSEPNETTTTSRQTYILHDPPDVSIGAASSRPSATDSGTGLIPVPVPEPTVEEVDYSAEIEVNDRNHHLPLNKKLSRYYIPNSDSFSSIHTGYEDLYTKRK